MGNASRVSVEAHAYYCRRTNVGRLRSMSRVEPIPDAPAAVATIDGERALVVADYHAGLESSLRSEGWEIENRADDRRERLLALIERSSADRVVVLGDLAHWIGEPSGPELEEIERLVDAVTERVPMVLVKGNHDGKIEAAVDVPVTDSTGTALGDVGFAHGHTHPAPEVVQADAVCVGHEHVTVRLEDAVGGGRVEQAWLRGQVDPAGFPDVDPEEIGGELIVFPAFNDLVGGTQVNVRGQAFLAPFLPDGIAGGQVYLLDGTRLGPVADL